MRKTSWFNILNSKLMSARPRSGMLRSSAPMVIERLEERQLLSAAAIPIGSEYRVNSVTTGDQTAPAAAMDSAGDYVVAWQSTGPQSGIFAQRYNAVGVSQGSTVQVTTDVSPPQVAMDAAGDFVIVWSGGDGSGAGVLAQRFDSAGVAQGSAIQVNTYTTGDQTSPSVAMDAAGDFVVAWESHGQFVNPYAQFIGDSNIYAQRYSSAGVAQGSEFRVDSSSTSVYHNPSVATDAAGDFVVAFERHDFDNFVEPFTYIAAARYNASGAVVQGEFGAAYGGQFFLFNPEVAMDPNGDFVIAYWGDNIETFVGIQVFDSNGNNLAGNAVNFDGALTQTHPDVAFGGNGDFTIAWELKSGNGPGSNYDVYDQQYDHLGNTVGSATKVNTFTPGDQVNPAVAMGAAGDIVFAWVSGGQDGSGAGIYSQQFFTDTGPLLLQIEGAPLNAVAQLFTPITSSLNVYDGQADTWTSATVKFSNGYQNGQDVLSFTNTAKITGSWDPATGTLTLSGTDSVSDYRAALRSITYHNTSQAPNTSTPRTISFQVNNGTSLSNTLVRNVNVLATSAPPTVTGLSATQTYVSSTAPLAIAANIVVTDPDLLNIQSATISFTNWQGEDRVSFSNPLGLQHTFVQDLNAHTATLTITGSATAAQYQTLLRSVTYQDVASQPNTTTRMATFTVNDQFHSGSAMTSISVVRYLSGVSATANYTQGSAPLAIAPNLLITQPAGITTLNSATVAFTNWQPEDRLVFSNSFALSYSFSQDFTTHTALLTIQQLAPTSEYQTELRSVTYQDVAGQPNTAATRIATITVNDGTNSASVTERVNVTKLNQPPVVLVNDPSQLKYKINAAAIPIMNKALISDPDSNKLSSLTVQISSGYQKGHDFLSFVNQLGIKGKFNAATGILTLTGVSSVANYRTALRAVKFHTTGSGVSTVNRVFKVIATDTTNTSSAPVMRSMTVRM